MVFFFYFFLFFQPIDVLALNVVLKQFLPEDEDIKEIAKYNNIKGIKRTVQSVLLSAEKSGGNHFKHLK